MYTIFSSTLFDQKSPVHREAGFPGGDNIWPTYIVTYSLNWSRGQFSENILSIRQMFLYEAEKSPTQHLSDKKSHCKIITLS